MTEGLITRLGRWIDHRWESKATESMVRDLFNSLENAAIKDKLDLEDKIGKINLLILDQVGKLKTDIELIVKAGAEGTAEKELADLKTRMEKIELYSGMTRKVDPTKPPIVKSAFQM